MDVINLKPLYDNCYKITLDPAAQSQRKPDPLYVVTPCKHGEIYPFGGDTLAVMVTSIRVACRLRREHPELKVHQNADDAMVFLLTVDQIDFIAAYVHPRRKRQSLEIGAIGVGHINLRISAHAGTKSNFIPVWRPGGRSGEPDEAREGNSFIRFQ